MIIGIIHNTFDETLLNIDDTHIRNDTYDTNKDGDAEDWI